MRKSCQSTDKECVCPDLSKLAESQSPEAARTVAGGPSEASDHRLNVRRVVDPGQGSRSKYEAARHSSATAAAVVNNGRPRRTGGLALRRDHRLPYEPPPAAFRRFDLTARQL